MDARWIDRHWIDDDGDVPLPPTSTALGPRSAAPGLVALGGRPTPARLAEAYGAGVFPWYSAAPAMWWSPDPRMVLAVDGFALHRSLAKTLRRFVRTPGCEIRIDHGFERVMRACATTPRAGQDGTWIVPEMLDGYAAWHAQGADGNGGAGDGPHSVETWVDGELVGGLYCVSIGRMVFGESMFAWRTDASKIALAALVAFCRANAVAAIDCQQNTAHLASLGAREVRRAAFERLLADATARAAPRWVHDRAHWATLGLDPDLDLDPAPPRIVATPVTPSDAPTAPAVPAPPADPLRA